MFERIRDLSLGFASLGISAGDRVAMISESRPEWVLCDMAVLALGGILVPIYPTLSAQQVHYILDDAGARLAVVSNSLQLQKVQDVRHLLPALEAVIVMDEGAALKASVMSLEESASGPVPSARSSSPRSSTPPARPGSRKG
jgi:long-chain acyl-CoA synthetase